MTDLRTAAQQALEALCCVRDMVAHPDNLEFIDKHITALKAALAEPVRQEWASIPGTNVRVPLERAEPVQEPVAWSHINGTSDTKWQPPQRKPLTDDEIKKLLIEHAGMTVVFSEVDLRFARAIERAHGIGGNDE